MRPLRRVHSRFFSGDRGSMAVEFVVAAPALVLLLLLVAAGGQWLNLTGKVGSATRDAVRSASLARTFADAQANAQTAAQSDLGACAAAAALTKVQLFTNGAPVGAGTSPSREDIEVTVSVRGQPGGVPCHRLPGQPDLRRHRAAPLDPFEDRG
jgi:Flp pilus assembly protein TadG